MVVYTCWLACCHVVLYLVAWFIGYFWLYVIIISVGEPICHILSLGKGSECEQAILGSHRFAKGEMSVRENELYLL